MRRLIALFLLLFQMPVLVVFATGDGNIDGGGGDMGSGTNQNKWIPGEDGVRVTIIDSDTQSGVTEPIDYTNTWPPEATINFGLYSKLAYRAGKALTPQNGGYKYCNPTMTMPTIISWSSGGGNIEALKRYFCSERIIKLIAQDAHFDFDTLITGNYKLLIEPIAYFTFQGKYIAMTATEAALYDQLVDGMLRRKMAALTHKNLPFSIFLERPDLGYPAWDGPTNANASNATIIDCLGLGIVKFTESDGEIDTGPVYDYTYRTDKDVITSIKVTTATEYNPDKPLTVNFTVNGRTYIVRNIVIPQNESQLVWFKWHTPKTPQVCKIDVKIGSARRTINANIEAIEESEPPDPKANDRNDGFKLKDTPNIGQTLALTWGAWSAAWHENWIWSPAWVWTGNRWVDEGKWEDQGWWDFTWNKYTASIEGTENLFPCRVPTASGNQIKSGYGYSNLVKASVTTNAPGNSLTQAQTAVTYFPEFQYQAYWRVLQPIVENSKAHFTPVWYPNSTYKVYTQLYDAWTPAGMLSINLYGTLSIRDNLFSDWHAAPQ